MQERKIELNFYIKAVDLLDAHQRSVEVPRAVIMFWRAPHLPFPRAPGIKLQWDILSHCVLSLT